MKRLKTFNGYMKINESQAYVNKLFELFKKFLDRFYDGGYLEVELDDEHPDIIRIDCRYVERGEDINALNAILVELQNKQLKGRIKILEVEDYEEYDLAFEDPDTIFFIEIFDGELPTEHVLTDEEVKDIVTERLHGLNNEYIDIIEFHVSKIIELHIGNFQQYQIDEISGKMEELIDGELRGRLKDITEKEDYINDLYIEYTGDSLYYQIQ